MISRLANFYATQLRVLWEWKGGRAALLKRLVVTLVVATISFLATAWVLPRMTIVEKVWDMNYEPSSNVIDVYISALRKKIDRDHERALIHTVVASGYRFGLTESA